MIEISSFFRCITVATIIIFTGVVVADDTEIYLSNTQTTTGTVLPNVLFVLDTSSSMTNTDGTGITRLDRMKTALEQIVGTANNVNIGLMRFHAKGGPVLYPVSYIDEVIETVDPDAGDGVSHAQISDGGDDAEEFIDTGHVDLTGDSLELGTVTIAGSPEESTTIVDISVSVNHENDAVEENNNGGMYMGSSDLELVADGYGSRSHQTIGIRFNNINIPADATILSAEIEFEIDEFSTTPTHLNIEGEKTANAIRFSSSNYNVSSRNTTNHSVDWPNVPAPRSDKKLITPNLVTIVDEITSLDNDWVSGNSMAFIISGSGKRVVESYNNGEPPPLLRIQYSTSGTPAVEPTEENQMLGLRFQNVRVPQGAIITSANIEFEAAGSHSETTALTIQGFDDNDTDIFTSNDSNISNRSTTGNVAWTVSGWENGQRYQSTDLSSVVQSIVNKSNWCGGNAMGFVITGAGKRVAKSYENDTTAAPVLHVEYNEPAEGSDACMNQTFRAQVSNGNDDAEEYVSSQSVNTSSSDLEMVEEGSEQIIGIRFRNVPVLKDSEISEAYLEFTADETSSESTSLLIKGELSGNSSAFTSSTANISSRNTTSSSVSWSPSAWSIEGETHRSPNIAALINQIVSQSGWAANNAMSFIISGSGKRVAESHNGEPGLAPVLIIKHQGELSTGFDGTVRQKMLNIVSEINWKSGTPIVDTLYEAARYYRGEGVHYGKTRGTGPSPTTADDSNLSRSQYTRLSHPLSYTDNDTTSARIERDPNCTDQNPNDNSCKTEYLSGNPTYNSPIAESCQRNYMVLLSDGYPSRNVSVDLVQSMIGKSCSGSGSGKCGVEIAEFLANTDQTNGDNFTGDQNVLTHTIGFNINSSGRTYLENIAQAGGGSFFPANSSAELVNAFQSIIIDILSHPTSFAAPSLSINAFNKIYHNNEVYFSLFKPDRHKAWPGNIKKYKLCEANPGDTCQLGEIIDADNDEAIGTDFYIKDTAKSFWGSVPDGPVIKLGGAGKHVPDYTNRNIYTYTDNDTPSNISFSVGSTHKIAVDNTALTKELLGDAAMSDDNRTELIEWIRGKDVENEDGDSATDNRWVIHDPLHGGAVPVTYGQANDDSPVIKLFVATNAGALHMINSATGVEEWAFIPQVMLSQQKDMMDTTEGNHIYGLDSTPTIYQYDADDDGKIEPADGDYVHLYIGMRRGGRNLYAFDITPTSEITDNLTVDTIAPKLLWRIEGGSGDYTKLGQTWSKPIVANVQYLGANKTVLLMAGGYEESSQDDGLFGPAADHGNAIYMIDAATGERLWWASSDAGADLVLPAMTYPIPSDVAALDTNGDGFINRLYVGDMGGQVWRIDSTSTGVRLAAISSSSNEADKRKFFYPPDVAQMRDTKYSETALYDVITIGSGNRDNPLDNDVHDRFYAFRDYHPLSIFDNDDVRLTDSDLYNATENLLQVGDEDEQSTALASLRSSKGWFIDLQEYGDSSWVGEKVLARSLIIDGKVFFTTYIPGETAAAACASAVEGGGRLYGMDLLTSKAIYEGWSGNQNELETVDRRYNVGAGIASEPIPIFQKNGVTLLVGSGGGATTVDPKIGLPRKKTFWLQEAIDGGNSEVGMCPI